MNKEKKKITYKSLPDPFLTKSKKDYGFYLIWNQEYPFFSSISFGILITRGSSSCIWSSEYELKSNAWLIRKKVKILLFFFLALRKAKKKQEIYEGRLLILMM